MTKEIKAIETHYKGYPFRSRTEARWAVFFDAMGWEWVYEKEGFYLSDGDCYLPDFWLPQINYWAEVKGEEFNEEEKRKAKNLAEGTGHDCLMLVGQPDFKYYETIQGSYMSLFWFKGQVGNPYYGEVGNKPGEYGYEDLLPGIIAARSARFEHENYTGPKRTKKPYVPYDPSDKSGECAECFKPINPRFTFCWTCKQLYE